MIVTHKIEQEKKSISVENIHGRGVVIAATFGDHEQDAIHLHFDGEVALEELKDWLTLALGGVNSCLNGGDQ